MKALFQIHSTIHPYCNRKSEHIRTNSQTNFLGYIYRHIHSIMATASESESQTQNLSLVEKVQALMEVIENSQKVMKVAQVQLKQVYTALVKAEKETTKMNKKATKDPNAPKRPRTAYIFFCEDQRVPVKNKSPEMSQTQLMCKLGELWKQLTDKKKQKYNDQAAKDKLRYEQEMSTYVKPSE